MESGKAKRFFSYVEIRTKITSLFAFFMALAYLYYLNQPVNKKLTIIFFLSMFLFDLTATAINNYIDTKTNAQKLQFKRKTALGIIYVLFLTSSALGLYLAYCTDSAVFLLGMLCFLCGVFYTYGPIPISRQPLGEIFSGIFYGLIIPFILLYINMPEGTYIGYEVTREGVTVTVMFLPVIRLLLLSAAPFCATANIMLANNICDVEKDIKVKRYTLPYYIGKKSLYLFAFLYYAVYGAAVIMVIFGFFPTLYLVMLLSIIPVQKNITLFFKEQNKETTFMCAIKNFIIVMSAHIAGIILCG